MSQPGAVDYPIPAIEAAATATASAASQCRAVDLDGPVGALRAALPGSLAADAGERLGEAWKQSLATWATNADGHAQSLRGAATNMDAADTAASNDLANVIPSILPGF